MATTKGAELDGVAAAAPPCNPIPTLTAMTEAAASPLADQAAMAVLT